MSIISRYILRMHIAPFLFGTITVIFIFMFQFLLKYIDSLVGKGLDYWIITQLLVLNLSWMLVLAVPMGVLFSCLMTFGNMSAVHEVTVIKASGGSLIKMMKPIVIAGIILTVALFWFNDAVLPEANLHLKTLLSDISRKKPTLSIENGQFSTQIEGYTILARSIDSSTGIMKGITIYDNTPKRGINIVSADTGKLEFINNYTKLILFLNKGEVHQLFPLSALDYRKINFERYQITMDASGFNFEMSKTEDMSRGDREMSIKDMQNIVDGSESRKAQFKESFDNEATKIYNYITGNTNDTTNLKYSAEASDTSRLTALKSSEKYLNYEYSRLLSDNFQITEFDMQSRQYQVEIHKKYSIPFACFLFVLIGCPLGVITKKGNFGISAAISLGFYLFYWACLIGGEKLADRGFMPPFISMWLGNIIISIIALILILRVNNETFKLKLFSKATN